MKTLNEQETWATALGELEVILSKANFTTWFRDTFILSIEQKEIIIGVPNAFTQEWLGKKYHTQIFETLKKIHPTTEVVSYSVTTKKPKINLIEEKETVEDKPDFSSNTAGKNREAQIKDRSNKNPGLNNKYTFETFVVGSSNRLAAATAQAVANKPGQVYNPLFLYGGVGLGKTHLMQAIGNQIAKKDPAKKVIYVSCEKFTNDFIQSISSGKINEFKKMYRDTDVLLVDDIQFLSGKEGTQEEFFYTFNALHQTNRQIVITSDRVPKAIPQIEERLTSRFGWGMVADIQSPNLEMRQAILRAKCIEKNCEMDESILSYIAHNIESNIRELEGAINRIISYCDLNNIKPTTDLVTQILEDVVVSRNKGLSVEKVLKTVADVFGIEHIDLISAKRNKELVWPRQIVMYLLRHEVNMSYPKIGRELNKKDHTTILYGVTKIEKEIAKNENLQKELTIIKDKLYST